MASESLPEHGALCGKNDTGRSHVPWARGTAPPQALDKSTASQARPQNDWSSWSGRGPGLCICTKLPWRSGQVLSSPAWDPLHPEGWGPLSSSGRVQLMEGQLVSGVGAAGCPAFPTLPPEGPRDSRPLP